MPQQIPDPHDPDVIGIQTMRFAFLRRASHVPRQGAHSAHQWVKSQSYVLGPGFVVPQSVIEVLSGNSRRMVLGVVLICAVLVAFIVTMVRFDHGHHIECTVRALGDHPCLSPTRDRKSLRLSLPFGPLGSASSA